MKEFVFSNNKGIQVHIDRETGEVFAQRGELIVEVRPDGVEVRNLQDPCLGIQLKTEGSPHGETTISTHQGSWEWVPAELVPK